MWGVEGYIFLRYACEFNVGHKGLVIWELKNRYENGKSLNIQICEENQCGT